MKCGNNNKWHNESGRDIVGNFIHNEKLWKYHIFFRPLSRETMPYWIWFAPDDEDNEKASKYHIGSSEQEGINDELLKCIFDGVLPTKAQKIEWAISNRSWYCFMFSIVKSFIKTRTIRKINVGDIIGNDSSKIAVSYFWSDDDDLVLIEVLSVNSDKVIKLGSFYSHERLTGKNGTSEGFILNEKILLKQVEDNRWNVIEPKNRPWFSLITVPDGTKTFTHYR